MRSIPRTTLGPAAWRLLFLSLMPNACGEAGYWHFEVPPTHATRHHQRSLAMCRCWACNGGEADGPSSPLAHPGVCAITAAYLGLIVLFDTVEERRAWRPSTSTWVPLNSLSGARGDPSEERIAVSMCLLRPLTTKRSRCSVSRYGVACRSQPTSQCGRARRFVLHAFGRVISGIIAKSHANGVKRTVLMMG